MIAVFQKAFRDSRRTVIWTGIGLGLYVLFCLSFYPTILEQADEFNELLSNYPPEMMAMFYGDAATDMNLADPITFLQTYIGVWGVLIIAAVVIVQAFNAITNEERSGAMDVLMSLPLTRREVLLGRIFNTGVGVLLMLTCVVVIVLLGTVFVEGFEVSLGDAVLSVYGAFLPIMVIAVVAYLLAVFVPSRRKFAGALAYLFLMGSYLLNGFAVTVESLDNIRPFLVFNYYSMSELATTGVNWVEWGGLLVVIVLGMGLAVWGWERKELAV